MNKVLISNNSLVKNEYENSICVEFTDTDLIGVLLHVRDKIHKGYKLLTHPLSGSIKPNESPFKTVLLSQGDAAGLRQGTGFQPQTDFQSVEIIEECIHTAQKFPQKQLNPEHLFDMQIIDLELIKSAVNSY